MDKEKIKSVLKVVLGIIFILSFFPVMALILGSKGDFLLTIKVEGLFMSVILIFAIFILAIKWCFNELF